MSLLLKDRDALTAAKTTGSVWIAAIALMALSALATGWFPLLAIDTLPSQNYNEGWNAYRQWMTLQGQPLYGARSEFWTTNYPFLSFHIIGLLGGAKANMVLAGRVVSFASLAAITWLAGAMVRDATGSRAGALFAGLALFAGICSFDGETRAVDDPELLAAAFGTFGLFAYLRASRGLAWPILSAIAFCLSLFTKDDYIAFPLSAAAHLIWVRNWRILAVFAPLGIAVAAGLLGLSFQIDGPYTLAELLQPRAYGLSNLLYETGHYLLHLAVPLFIGLVLLWRGRAFAGREFLLILLVLTNLAAFFFAGGDGVAHNIFYPPIIADLLACVIGICWLERQESRLFTVALVCATLGLAVTVPFRLIYDIQAQLGLPKATLSARQAIALLDAAKGPAICEDLLLCYEAGKPMDYDPYYVKDQIRIGRVQDASIVALLDAHHYAAIQLGGAADGDWRKRMRGRFTPAFQRAFLADYRPVLVGRYDLVFVPSRGG